MIFIGMNRISAKCGDCGQKFQADEQMLEAGYAVVAGDMTQNLCRTGVVCPSCTSPNIEKA